MHYTKAQAHISKKKGPIIRLKPQQLCHVGCETPTINYNFYGGKKYRYFYAITSDVDDEISAGQIYKVDTWTGEVINVRISLWDNIPGLDILFSSNRNIHKSLYRLCFWASDPLIERV